jgi:glycerol-3-phosphate dehydrogenase
LNERFDVVIIGGGATGLGAAVDAASRGYRTAVLEAHEIGSGTSGRSTKLIHGGLRYLAQGRIGLVRESLAERAVLFRIAPQLVREVGIVVPVRTWPQLAYYASGLKIYDALAGRQNLAASRILSRKSTLAHVPNLRAAELIGSVRYVDGQFDDLGFVRALARTAESLGAEIVERAPVTSFLREGGGRIAGVIAGERRVLARVVVNATGVWADELRRLSDANTKALLAPSRGSHLLFPAEALGGSDGFLIPKTDDGRVIFALPWNGRTLVGTTDVPVTSIEADPQPSDDEVVYLIAHVNRYLEHPVSRADVVGVFAGLRPLVAAGATPTSGLSREHHIEVDRNGLVSVLGGKWTTYRRMAKDAIDRAAQIAQLPLRPSRTEEIMVRR